MTVEMEVKLLMEQLKMANQIRSRDKRAPIKSGTPLTCKNKGKHIKVITFKVSAKYITYF